MKKRVLLVFLAVVLVVSLGAFGACGEEEEPVVEAEEYSLAISAVGEGTTNPAPGTSTKTEGATVHINAIPRAGYVFDHWEGDVSETTRFGKDHITVEMTSDKSVVAVFVEEPEEGVILNPNPVTPGPPVYGGIIKYIQSDLGGFDLHLGPSWGAPPLAPIFNNLIQFNLEYTDTSVANLIGDLAESWEVSDDGLTYTFKLRQGVQWHDGEPFNADDVVYSMEKMVDPERSRVAGYLPALESVEKVDDYTVIVHTSYVSAGFLLQLAGPYVVIEAEHLKTVDNTSFDFLVGTGPFMFSNYEAGKQWELVRNPNYFKKDKDGNQLPYLDGVTMYIGTGTAGTDAYIAKRLDLLHPGQTLFMASDLERVRSGAPDTVYQQATANMPYAYWFNFNFEPFKDVRVRKAIAMVMKSEDQLIAWTGDIELGDVGGYLFGSTWRLPKEEIAELIGWDQPYEDRIAEAQQLMKDAGYADGFEMGMLYQAIAPGVASEAGYSVLADKLKRYLNIDAVLQGVPAAELYKRRATGEFDLFSSVIYALVPDPDAFMGYFYTDDPANFYGYSNPEVDALWDKQSAEMDPVERLKIVQDIERTIIKDMPMLPGIFVMGYRIMYPHVKNFRYAGSMYGPCLKFEDVWMEK